MCEPIISACLPFMVTGGTMADAVEQARHGYAEELRFTAKVSSRAVVKAFATVPRERFVGPGPWRIKRLR